MIILAGLLLAIASVPLAGHDLRLLAQMRVRGIWFVVGAFVAQIMITAVFDQTLGDTAARTVHLATYAATAAFIVMNRHVRGVALVGIGGGMNLIAIVANGGVMPASAWASRAAGFTAERGFQNSQVLARAHLLAFGDVLAIPRVLPFANVFSVGDAVLLVGACIVLHAATGRADAAEQQPGVASADADRAQRDRDAVQH